MKHPFRLRKPLFFPLNYVDVSIADCRSRIAEFKCERELYRAFRSSTAIELRPGSIRLRVSDLRSSIVGFNPEHGAGNSIAEPQIDHGSLATEPALLSTLERVVESLVGGEHCLHELVCPLRLKRKFGSRSGMCCLSTLSATPNCSSPSRAINSRN